MLLLRCGRAFIRILPPKLIKTFILSVLVITNIQVTEGVRWIKQPTDQSVVVGSSAKFECQAADLGDAGFLWNKGVTTIFFNGQRNSGVDLRYRIENQNDLVIDNVELGDESLYSCAVFGYDEVQVHLTVWVPPQPPVIAMNSSGQLVENTVISLTCSSQGGKPAPTITWLKNGQPINSAISIPPTTERGTSSSQIVVDITRQDHSANYSCKVYNDANQNSPLVSSRILNVQYSPSIHFEPDYSPYKVKLNSRVRLTCVVEANPVAHQIQWKKDGLTLQTSSHILNFDAIRKSDAGVYTCTASNRVQNQVKTSTNSVTVEVIYAPVVTTQPIIIANISTQVNMSCSVDANPPATEIRWQKIQADPIHASGPNFVFIAEKRYIGNYSCTASNQLEPSGQAIESVQSTGYATLRIQYAPGQASISPTSSALVGQPVMLTCTVDDPGYPNPNFEWRKSGSSQILQSTTSHVYRIESAALSDNGNYSCLPRNLIGQGLPAMILLEVNSPPTFIQSVPSVDHYTVSIDQPDLLLQHKIEGRPLPVVQWFKDSVPLSIMPKLFKIVTTNTLVDQYKYRVTSTVTFVGSDRNQNSLRIDDMGNYTCQVMSTGSMDTVSKSMFLSIDFEPVLTADSRVAADVSELAVLTCNVQANPKPLFYWYDHREQLDNNSRITITQQGVDGIAKYESYLQIRGTSFEDFGEYICEVVNAKGQSRKKVTLSPKDKPDPPTNLASVEKTWESVYLRWEPGFNGGFEQTFFVHVNSIYGERNEEVHSHGSHTFNVTHLMPQTSYTFHVYGKNQRGQGNNSAGFTAQTDVLVFPPLKEIPEYRVEERHLTIPNDLNESYCLRVEVSKDSGKVWTTAESCVTPSDKSVALSLQTATNVNVSVCLVYRPEVCGEPVVSKIYQADTPDLTREQVIIIGCVCAGILVVLLVVLIVVLCRRRQRNKNYQSDPHSPRLGVVQQGNGVIPQKQPQQRPYDNTDGLQLDNRNGYPTHIQFNVDTSYDSQTYDPQFEHEMNRRNANLSGDPYFEKQGDMSFNGSPRTPTKDPQQFINLPEENHKREGGSVGSGNESGYSTPDPAKPKKSWTLKPYLLPALQSLKRPILPRPRPHNAMQTNPDMVPYSHNPPGHTCGLPCCSEELQIQLRVKRPKTCIGFQNVDDVLAENFTFRRGKLLKDRPVLENGFFSVQQKKESQHAAIPKFGSVSKGMAKTNDDLGRHNFLKGREITLPETKDPDATNKLYLEDFYTGESDDLLDVTSDKDIEYYMTEKNPAEPEKGVPYSQKDLDGKEMYPWDLMVELKSKTSQSEKTDDTNSSNYYEVLNYSDSIQSSSENEKSDPSLSLKRIKKFPIAKPLPEVPPKVPLQNLFNHPPLNKSGSKRSASNTLGYFKQNSTDSDKNLNKYHTYSSLHSINSEKKKLENQENQNQKHRSLCKSYSGKKWRQDAREINFEAPEVEPAPKVGGKVIKSPRRSFKRKKMKQFERTEKENENFNIMLNSELVKLKKFFQQDDDDVGDDDMIGHTNDAVVKGDSTGDLGVKSGLKDSPITLIL